MHRAAITLLELGLIKNVMQKNLIAKYLMENIVKLPKSKWACIIILIFTNLIPFI